MNGMIYNNMYNDFVSYVKSINNDDFAETAFKSNPSFTYVLEHTNPKQGIAYLKSIETEFPDVTYDELRKFINLNDKYGNSIKSIFTTKQNKMLYCSASNMRYMYQALVILKEFKEKQATSIVEIGAGYGGLFLAINHFAEKQGVKIKQYKMVDLTDVCILINNYLELNKSGVSIPYEFVDATTYGQDIVVDNDEKLFLISNYCFTELEEEHRKKYIQHLFSKVEHGFIIWQTCFGIGLDYLEKAMKNKKWVKTEETPQTASVEFPNYFITF